MTGGAGLQLVRALVADIHAARARLAIFLLAPHVYTSGCVLCGVPASALHVCVECWVTLGRHVQPSYTPQHTTGHGHRIDAIADALDGADG